MGNIEVKELRIGNYIKYDGSLNIVTGIIPAYPSKEHPNPDFRYWIEINPPDVFNIKDTEVDGLRLTDEWIEKHPHKKDIIKLDKVRGQHFYLVFIGYLKLNEDGTDEIEWKLIQHVEYVHEWQNLYYAIMNSELCLL